MAAQCSPCGIRGGGENDPTVPMNAGQGAQDSCQRVPVDLSVSVWCQEPAGQPDSPAQGAAAEPSPCVFRTYQLPASCVHSPSHSAWTGPAHSLHTGCHGHAAGAGHGGALPGAGEHAANHAAACWLQCYPQ